MFENAIGYVEKNGHLGFVGAIDFMAKSVTLVDEESSQVYDISEVEILKSAFVLNGVEVFNKDVLKATNEFMYLVEVHDDGKLQLHVLDEKLEKVKSGEKFEKSEATINQLNAIMELEGSYYELLAELNKSPEFNIEIVKSFDGKHYTYYYACNNKEAEEIDLLKVVFMGHHIFEQEEYERNTMSHSDYLAEVNNGVLKSVSPQELHNYALGLLYNDNTNANDNEEPMEEPVEVEEIPCDTCDCENGFCEELDSEVETSLCKSCNKELDICTCELW